MKKIINKLFLLLSIKNCHREPAKQVWRSIQIPKTCKIATLPLVVRNDKRGFSLVEALVAMLIMSVVIVSALPVMTKMSELKSGTDRNSMNCIINGAPDVYNSNGTTNMPTPGTSCYGAVVGCKFNLGKSCDTLTWQAQYGTTSERQTAAKKILRATCDQGGEKACDWFIKQCVQNGSENSPYCDDTNSFFDVTYYLKLLNNDTANLGRLYFMDQLSKFGGVMKIVNELYTDCIKLPNSTACNVITPITFIANCNNGDTNACTLGYNNNYNRTCSQIKNSFSSLNYTAQSGTYKITIKGASSPVSVTCDMSTGLMNTPLLLQTYYYTGGAQQSYTTAAQGTYKIEAYGAQGGNGGTRIYTGGAGGQGGYAYGDISLNNRVNLYIYVGGIGLSGLNGSGSYCSGSGAGGFGAGGGGGCGCGGGGGGGGGGSTDVRKDGIALDNRVIVAGGGGGGGGAGGIYSAANGGDAGGLIGFAGGYGSNNNTSSLNYTPGGGGYQGSGGAAGKSYNPTAGGLGYGGGGGTCSGIPGGIGSSSSGNGGTSASNMGSAGWNPGYGGGGGGGSGYYGGGGGSADGNYTGSGSGGGGGSSYYGGMTANTGTRSGFQSGYGQVKIWLK